MDFGSFVFNTVVSIGVGVAVTALVAGTGPLGIAAAVAVKGAEVGIGLNAVLAGCATGLTNIVLNNSGGSSRSFGSSGFSGFSGGGGRSSSSNNQSGKSNTNGSSSSSNAGSTGDSNDPNRDSNKKDSDQLSDSEESDSTDQEEDDCENSTEIDFTSTESAELKVSSDSNYESKDHKKRDIRYKNPKGRSYRFKKIRKHFKGQGKFFEIDHAPSLAILKQLIIKIKSYGEKNIPQHLKRVVKMLKIFFKTNDLQNVNENRLRELYGSTLFAILVIKSVHRGQESTGNSGRQRAYTNDVVGLFMQGNIVEAFERIFQDHHETIMDQQSSLDRANVETLYDWIMSFIDYLFRRHIITSEEKDRLMEYINNFKTLVLQNFF